VGGKGHGRARARHEAMRRRAGSGHGQSLDCLNKGKYNGLGLRCLMFNLIHTPSRGNAVADKILILK